MNAPLPIGQTLLAAGLIGEDQLRIALHEQLDRRQPLGHVLVQLGFTTSGASAGGSVKNISTITRM